MKLPSPVPDGLVTAVETTDDTARSCATQSTAPVAGPPESANSSGSLPEPPKRLPVETSDPSSPLTVIKLDPESIIPAAEADAFQEGFLFSYTPEHSQLAPQSVFQDPVILQEPPSPLTLLSDDFSLLPTGRAVSAHNTSSSDDNFPRVLPSPSNRYEQPLIRHPILGDINSQDSLGITVQLELPPACQPYSALANPSIMANGPYTAVQGGYHNDYQYPDGLVSSSASAIPGGLFYQDSAQLPRYSYPLPFPPNSLPSSPNVGYDSGLELEDSGCSVPPSEYGGSNAVEPSAARFEDASASARGFSLPPSQQSAEEPYAKLIWRSLMSVPRHAMTLQEIYQWFRENTDKAKAGTKGWQNSIRHNLSMNEV